MGVVDGSMVEHWELKEGASSQVIDVNVVLTDIFENLSCSGTSIVTSMVFPVVVVRLDDEPLSSSVAKGLNMSSSESVSGNNSSLARFCSGENDVSKGISWGILQVSVSTVIGSTVHESISGNPRDLLKSDRHHIEIFNKPPKVVFWLSRVLRK